MRTGAIPGVGARYLSREDAEECALIGAGPISRARKVVDNWKMYEARGEELPNPTYPVFGSIGCLYYDWSKEGILTPSSLDALGDIIAGKIPGRRNEEDIILFGQAGQPVYDVAWACTVYRRALELGVGQKLNLWVKPYMH